MPSERVQRQIDRLLDEAQEAVVNHGWETVRARAESALAYDPENEDAHTFLEVAARASSNLATSNVETSESEDRVATQLKESIPADQPTIFADGR